MSDKTLTELLKNTSVDELDQDDLNRIIEWNREDAAVKREHEVRASASVQHHEAMQAAYSALADAYKQQLTDLQNAPLELMKVEGINEPES